VSRLLSGFLVFTLLLSLCACGNVFIRGALLPASSTVNGVVSVVQLGSGIATDGTTVQITFVTFLFEGTSSTVGFCGNLVDQFPVNQTVRTQFTPGQPCAALIVVIVA
jgi:hypothetical protein